MASLPARLPEPPLAATSLTMRGVDRPAPASGVVDLIKTYRRHLALFILVAGSVIAVAAAITFLQTPRYTATAELVVAPRPAEIGADRTTPLQCGGSSVLYLALSSYSASFYLSQSHSMLVGATVGWPTACPSSSITFSTQR